MKYYTYALIDPKDNKIFYIGYGQNRRMYNHVNEVQRCRIPNKTNIKLGNKIKKILFFGDKIKYKKVFITENRMEALNKEKELIVEIGLENLCNLSAGGEGCRMSEETKRKISKSLKGRSFSEEHKRKLSLAHKGLKHSEDTVQKILDSRSWYKHSDETKRKLSVAHKGKSFSEEHRKKLSESHKGNISGKGNKGRIPWNKGIARSEETKRKISKSLKGAIPWNKGLKLKIKIKGQ